VKYVRIGFPLNFVDCKGNDYNNEDDSDVERLVMMWNFVFKQG